MFEKNNKKKNSNDKAHCTECAVSQSKISLEPPSIKTII